MKVSLVLTVSMFVLAGFLPALVFADQFNFGALEATGLQQEKVSFGLGKNFKLDRVEISIPKKYGRLITITNSNGMNVFWFESEDGVIRNVNIDPSSPVIIKRDGDLD